MANRNFDIDHGICWACSCQGLVICEIPQCGCSIVYCSCEISRKSILLGFFSARNYEISTRNASLWRWVFSLRVRTWRRVYAYNNTRHLSSCPRFLFSSLKGKLLSFSTSLYLAMVMGTSILDDAGQGYLSESWFCELSSYKRAIFKLKPMFFLNSYSRRVSSSRVSSRKLRSCRTNLYAVMETAAWKYWGFAASVIDSLSMPTFR